MMFHKLQQSLAKLLLVTVLQLHGMSCKIS